MGAAVPVVAVASPEAPATLAPVEVAPDATLDPVVLAPEPTTGSCGEPEEHPISPIRKKQKWRSERMAW